MRRMSVYTACVAMAVLAVAAGSVRAADWPQFRGPNGDNISPEKGLARTWPASGPAVAWKVDLGQGFGAPAISGGKVYLLDRDGDTRDVLKCFDLATGKPEWTWAHDYPGKIDANGGSRGTPAVDDKVVCAYNPFGMLYAVDKATHQPLWSADTMKEYGSANPGWGFAQSPLLYKDLVIASPLGRQVGVAAYEKTTGKVRWRSPALGPLAYVSPQVVTLGGADQIIVEGKEKFAGLDAASGRLLWSYQGWPGRMGMPIPNPTSLGDGRFFLTGGYEVGSVMVKVAQAGGAWQASEVSRIPEYGSQIHGAIHYGGNLYVVCNSNRARDGLMCFDLSGKKLWQTGPDAKTNFERGGYLATADGLLYLLDGRGGELALVELSPAGYKELARCRPLGRQMIWAPPALSDGRLVVRDQRTLVCLDVRGK